MHLLACCDGNVKLLLVSILFGLVKGISKRPGFIGRCVEPIKSRGNHVPMLVLLQLIHGRLIDVTTVEDDIHAMLDALLDRISSSGMRAYPQPEPVGFVHTCCRFNFFEETFLGSTGFENLAPS